MIRNVSSFVIKATIVAILLLVFRSPIAMALVGLTVGALVYHFYPLETKAFICEYSAKLFEFLDLPMQLGGCSKALFI